MHYPPLSIYRAFPSSSKVPSCCSALQPPPQVTTSLLSVPVVWPFRSRLPGKWNYIVCVPSCLSPFGQHMFLRLIHWFCILMVYLFLLQEIFYGRPSNHLEKSICNISKDLVKLWDGCCLSFSVSLLLFCNPKNVWYKISKPLCCCSILNIEFLFL